MPRSSSSRASTSPAGPAPTIPTCVSIRVFSSSVRAREAGSPGASSSTLIAANTISATVQPPAASCTAPSSHGPTAATM